MQNLFDEFTEHEAYFNQKDYSVVQDKFSQNRINNINPRHSLIVSKYYFQEKKYQKCIKILSQIKPSTPLIIYEKGLLLFKATYLIKRKQAPSIEHLNKLNTILEQIQSNITQLNKGKLQIRHLKVIRQYKQFVKLLQISNLSLKLNIKQLKIKRKQSNSLQFEALPCFLISKVWLNDLEDLIQKKSESQYIGPICNFSIINDFFQFNYFSDPINDYLETFIFPSEEYEVVNRSLWNYYLQIFNQKKSLFTVKRFYKPIISTNITTIFQQLNKFVIKFQDIVHIFQVRQKQLIHRQLLYILHKIFGYGQLKSSTVDKSNKITLKFQNIDSIMQRDISRTKRIFEYIKFKNSINVAQKFKQKYFKLAASYELSPLKTSKKSGLVGLQNLKNSCYMSSSLQCLSHTKPLTQFLITSQLLQIINFNQTNGMISYSLADLLKQIWSSQKNVIEPFQFKKTFGSKNPQFSRTTQEDAHQFLTQLLNNLDEQLRIPTEDFKKIQRTSITTSINKMKQIFQNSVLKKNRSIVTNLLRGVLHNTIECINCKAASHSFDIFLILSLPIPNILSNLMNVYCILPHSSTEETKNYEISLEQIHHVSQLWKLIIEERKSQNKDYLLIGFNKESFKVVWQCCESKYYKEKKQKIQFCEQANIQEMQRIQNSSYFCFFQIQKMKSQNQTLVLINYYSEKDIRVPQLLFVQNHLLLQKNLQTLKQLVVKLIYSRKVNQYKKLIQKINLSQESGYFYSYKLDVFFSYQGQIPRFPNYIYKELNKRQYIHTLDDCLNQMKKKHELDGQWNCSQCKKKSKGIKQEQIYEVNEIFMICLQRFKANNHKIKNQVRYPLILDLKDHIAKNNWNAVYQLYAVCLHNGSADYGHYRAYCKQNNRWYLFDDDNVKEVEQKQVISPYAYMLFYQKQ